MKTTRYRSSGSIDPGTKSPIASCGWYSAASTLSTDRVPRALSGYYRYPGSLLSLLTAGINMNDSVTLGFYTHMQVFRNSPKTEGNALRFPSTLSSQQRSIVCMLAEKLGLHHTIEGSGTEVCIQVSRCKFLSPSCDLRPQVSIPDIGHVELNSSVRLWSVTSLGNLGLQRSERNIRQYDSVTAQAETCAEAISSRYIIPHH